MFLSEFNQITEVPAIIVGGRH